ncbi:MAG: MBOAT family protein [bacterium]|nr:MBOAT family protein [bacterium]
MLFNSIQYFIFLPIVAILYFILPFRFRWFWLLLSSFYFYMAWRAEYAVLMVAAVLINYTAGIMISRSEKKGLKKFYMLFGVCASFLILFVFKYFNFINALIASLFARFGFDFPVFSHSLLLPVGISFYTFQTLSYTIDVYRGREKTEKHLGVFALYVTFFPQLVAGPIERSTNLLPQFFRKNNFDLQRCLDGGKLILWGLFKKIVIADRLAVLVNTVFNNTSDYSGFQFVTAIVFFAFQIYCDFSGYSDIAIGTAQIMGYKLMDNFNRPYFSKSISEFWKRWHISLSTWFRDYLYIPLGGSRVSVPKWYFNLFFTFLVSGIWHGANTTFVIWGALNGFYMVAETFLSKRVRSFELRHKLTKHKTLLNATKITFTFFLVLFAWIFFRANTLSDAFYVISKIPHDFKRTFAEIVSLDESAMKKMGMERIDFVISIAVIIFMEGVHLLQRHRGIRTMLKEKPAVLRYAVYAIFIFGLIVFGTYINPASFIYFQF